MKLLCLDLESFFDSEFSPGFRREAGNTASDVLAFAVHGEVCYQPGMPKLIDLTGKRFGRVTVLRRNGANKNFQPYWDVRCDCGGTKRILGCNLRYGTATSCGCERDNSSRRNFKKVDRRGNNIRRAVAREGVNYVSSADPWYKLASGRFYLARKQGIPLGFSSNHEFASYCKSIAPTHCPVFGAALSFQREAFSPWSFSIDKIDPALGYVRGNVQVISLKANLMKRDAAPDELTAFARWVLRR